MKHGNLEPEETVMKQTENYEQLLQRFTKRVIQLEEKQEKVRQAHEEWLKYNKELERLEGSIQPVEYLAFGKLPHDGNHDGMKDHTPSMPVVITTQDEPPTTFTIGEGSIISSGMGSDDITITTNDGTIKL